jgi:hypothetical protein
MQRFAVTIYVHQNYKLDTPKRQTPEDQDELSMAKRSHLDDQDDDAITERSR